MGWFFKGLPSGKRVSQFTRWRPPTVRQTLLGVASFHRACLLAQDFTHEPACQTGERAPQGRFRHQPEQMVHPPFAWQLASFPSLPVCGVGGPVLSLAEHRHPTGIFLGNQGTASHFCLLVSLSGTGRDCRLDRTGLPGDIPARPRFTDEYTLRHRGAFQCSAWPASGRWNQDDLGNLCRR